MCPQLGTRLMCSNRRARPLAGVIICCLSHFRTFAGLELGNVKSLCFVVTREHLLHSFATTVVLYNHWLRWVLHVLITLPQRSQTNLSCGGIIQLSCRPANRYLCPWRSQGGTRALPIAVATVSSSLSLICPTRDITTSVAFRTKSSNAKRPCRSIRRGALRDGL
jgi:hypothetical protein